MTIVAGWRRRGHIHFGAILPTTQSHLRRVPIIWVGQRPPRLCRKDSRSVRNAGKAAVVMREHRKRLWHSTINDVTLEYRRRHPLPES